MVKEATHIEGVIEGCKRDERKAQEQLYLYFYDAMMNLCVRYTKSEEEAEHVLNDGFLRVFKNIQQYDSAKGALYTWIFRIVMNCCLYYYKSKRAVLAESELTYAEDVHIEPEVDIKLKEEEILQLIRNLPTATQAVFNLYIIDGYAHKEIAAMLEISEGTSKWHLNEARKRLKLQLLQKENIG